MLDAPHLRARPPEPGLNFVADEDAAVLPNDPDGRLEVLGRRRDEPSDSLDRLGQESGDATRRRGPDDVLDVVRARDPARRIGQVHRAAVAVRRRRVLDPGDFRGKRPPARLGRQGLREGRAAGVTVPQRDHLRAAGEELGHHHRSLVGFRAGRREIRLFEIPRRDSRQPLGQLDHRERGIKRRDVREPVHLSLDRCVDLLVRVTDRNGQDAAEEVEILVAVGVADPQSLRLGDDDRLLVVLDRRRKEVLLVLLASGLREIGGGAGSLDVRAHFNLGKSVIARGMLS